MRHCAAKAWEGDRSGIEEIPLMSPETGLKKEPTGFLSPDVAVGDGMVGKADLRPSALLPACLSRQDTR